MATGTPFPAPFTAPTPTATRTLAQQLKAVAPSIVRIRTEEGEGTGFVVFAAGQVMTAFHVVGSSSARPTVIADDGTEHRSVVLGMDEDRDLALLMVPGLSAAPLALARGVSIGDAVLAVGYAAGLGGDPSITRGIISAQRTEQDSGLRFLQTDAPINPGNSGGPLLDETGAVVGVNVARLRGSKAQYENMGFAVSVEEVRGIADALRAGNIKLARPAEPTTAPAALPTNQARLQLDARKVVLSAADLGSGWTLMTGAIGGRLDPSSSVTRFQWTNSERQGAGLSIIFSQVIVTGNGTAACRLAKEGVTKIGSAELEAPPVGDCSGATLAKLGDNVDQSARQSVDLRVAIDNVYLEVALNGYPNSFGLEDAKSLMEIMISRVR